MCTRPPHWLNVFSLLGKTYGAINANPPKVAEGIGSRGGSFQLCVCPFQWVNQTVGTGWIMDVVVMIAQKCKEREGGKERKVFPKPGQMFELALFCIQASILAGNFSRKHNSCLLFNLHGLAIRSGMEPTILVQTLTVACTPLLALTEPPAD